MGEEITVAMIVASMAMRNHLIVGNGGQDILGDSPSSLVVAFSLTICR